MDDIALLWSGAFTTIGLDGLNATSELLDRTERKYIVQRSRMQDLLRALAPHFHVLEHAGKRMSLYESVYFDNDYLTYRLHHQGKRRRFKLRSRLYADSGACFFEMKVKRRRGSTDKRRIAYDARDRFSLDERAHRFMKAVYKEAYGEELSIDPVPVLNVVNHRITLVAKDGGERLTIDLDVSFENHIGKYVAPKEFVIIETKTRNGRGFCDKLLMQQGLRPVRGCSKYCIGVAELGLVAKRNVFLPVFRKIRWCGEGTRLPASQWPGAAPENAQEAVRAA